MRLEPAAHWRARLRAAADAPPRPPRVPLRCAGVVIGSVEPDLFARAGLASAGVLREAEGGWDLVGEDLSSALDHVARTLHARGLGHAWRHEQLAVRAPDGRVLGTVERGAARVLGLATDAVHLLAVDPAGRHWVQQRAFDKPSDPGLWDTTVGGLVPASDSIEQALARETWEEAGLRIGVLLDLRHGGRVATRRPFREVAHGYVVETLHWYTGTLPDGAVPVNQDGEVAGFRCLPPGEVTALLEQDAFTIDAALVLLAAFAAPGSA